jgi:hypothetical protein
MASGDKTTGWDLSNSLQGAYGGGPRPVSGAAVFSPSYTTPSGSTTITPSVSHACGGGQHAMGGGLRVEHRVSPATSISASVSQAPFRRGMTTGVGFTFRF